MVKRLRQCPACGLFIYGDGVRCYDCGMLLHRRCLPRHVQVHYIRIAL